MTPNILPLLWLHGEPFEILEEEIREMYNAGLRGFIAESRPFPGYMEEDWWNTLEFILSLADELGMKVMLFDDSHFPSGYADGIIAEKYPEHLRLFLEMKNREFSHPGGVFRFDPEDFLSKNDRAVRKVYLLEKSAEKTFRAESVKELSASGGTLELAPGNWILNVWVVTRNGGEDHTRNYIHFLSPDAVQCYINTVYVPHVKRLQRFIGKSFIGFFSDEPRIANLPSYDAILGKSEMPLPYSEKLFLEDLPFLALESDRPEWNKNARARFMDEVSTLYSEAFPQQIGKFCREHGLLYIGHVIEDNGAHCRLGYGNGHFFRSMNGQSWAGVDTVLGQNRPGHPEGIRDSAFGKYNDLFYHWGLMNLAGSAGTLNRTPAFCEIFGAYGWSEGLSEMKWLTDLAIVSGINRLVPHAFSPKKFPDSDCPPHFYAHGKNPQWKYFPLWVQYADRLCKMFSNGKNAANTGLLYHAEAEWRNGNCLPNELVLKTLSNSQIGAITIPFDLLKNPEISDGSLIIGDASIRFLLAADFDTLPEQIRITLSELEKAGITLIKVTEDNLPSIPAFLKKSGADALICHPEVPDLRCFHYKTNDSEKWFLVNESSSEIRTELNLPDGNFYFIDPVQNTVFSFDKPLILYGNQSMILTTAKNRKITDHILFQWTVTQFSCECRTWDSPEKTEKRYPDQNFSGNAVYSLEFTLDQPVSGEIVLPEQKTDVVCCKINGKSAGICFAPPYHFDTADLLISGKNSVSLELTNTLGPIFREGVFDKDSPAPPPGLQGVVEFHSCKN